MSGFTVITNNFGRGAIGIGAPGCCLELLSRLVQEIDSDGPLNEAGHLKERIEALERLEQAVIALPDDSLTAAAVGQARETQARLEAANNTIYETIRHEIQRGRGRDALLQWMPWLEKITESAQFEREDYDFLDDVMAGVLRFAEPEPPRYARTEEMVFYQPTPARNIFELFEKTALTDGDVLIDLGSGLGHVPILASIWAGTRSVGVEVEPAYVDCARGTVEALKVERVEFVQVDARTADLSSGTVFYLYTPFKGGVMRQVLERLRAEAERRPIRVCTLGQCTRTIAAEGWLEESGEWRAERIAVFRLRQ